VITERTHRFPLRTASKTNNLTILSILIPPKERKKERNKQTKKHATGHLFQESLTRSLAPTLAPITSNDPEGPTRYKKLS
jgi:Leucine-rich repeat (LRR) protein